MTRRCVASRLAKWLRAAHVLVSGAHGHARVRRARANRRRCCALHHRALSLRLPLPACPLCALCGSRHQSCRLAMRPGQRCVPRRHCCLGRAWRCLRCARRGAAPTSPQQRRGPAPLRTCGTKSPRRCHLRGPRRSSGCRAPGAHALETRAPRHQPASDWRQGKEGESASHSRGRALEAADGWPCMRSGSSTSRSYFGARRGCEQRSRRNPSVSSCPAFACRRLPKRALPRCNLGGRPWRRAAPKNSGSSAQPLGTSWGRA